MPSSKLRNNLMRDMIAPQRGGLENNPKAKLVPLDRIASNPFQVRQDFSSTEAIAALEELASDIRQHGILQPILVRSLDNAEGKFEIVAGERRYRAATIAQLSEVPVIIEKFSDEEARLASLTENLQRRDLNFKEEVDFLAQLDGERSLNGKGGESDLAQLIHKSRTYVAKRLKLSAFPALVEQVSGNTLSINEAYALAVAQDKSIASDNSNKVFPGNTSTPDKAVEKVVRDNRSFTARIVPFVRLREAVAALTQELDRMADDERASLKAEVSQLEQELAQLRARL